MPIYYLCDLGQGLHLFELQFAICKMGFTLQGEISTEHVKCLYLMAQ